MLKNKSLLISIVGDIVLVNAATILAFLTRFSGRIPAVNFGAYLEIVLWITIIRIVVFYFSGLYERDDGASPFDVFYSIVIAVTLGSIIIVALSFYLRTLPFPRSVFLISWVFNILLISCWHSYLIYKEQKTSPPKRVLIVDGPAGKKEEIFKEIKNCSFTKYEVVDSLIGNDKGNLRKRIKEKRVDGVIITDSNLSHNEIIDIVFDCQAQGVKVLLVPGLYEVIMGKMRMTHLGEIPLIELSSEPLKEKDKVAKKIMDTFFSLFVLLLFSPLMLLIAIIIKMGSKGPVLYKQKRVGMKGKIYEVYKFRSMFDNAEERTGPVLARRNDERETKIGRLLRRLHLDELPQFLNILKGEMSLIGPRPERPVFVKEFEKAIPGYSGRFLVRPGIAGLAQLYGEYDTSPENKLKYDLTYINNWSLGLDLKIFFMSLEIILTRRM